MIAFWILFLMGVAAITVSALTVQHITAFYYISPREFADYKTYMDPENRLKVYEHMKKHSVLIVGTCRDVVKQLPFNIERLSKCAKYFKDYKFIIYENDSTDGTAEWLDTYSNLYPDQMVIIHETLNIPAASPLREHPTRFERMAHFRNKYLNELSSNKYDAFDYVLVTDLDLVEGCTPDGLASCFECPYDWDSIGANGNSVSRGRFYDTLPLRSLDNRELTNVEIRNLLKQEQFVKVSSCFGGMSIYKRNAIIKGRYTGDQCEHIGLYTSMSENGFNNHYINQKFRVFR